VIDDARSGSAVAVTAPVTYATESLEQRLRSGAPALVQPDVLTFLPCARLPKLANGIAGVPRTLVTSSLSPSPVRFPGSSPFAGLLDMYAVSRLSLADSKNPPDSIVVFELDDHIRGATIAEPAARPS
jgi:hypothetical protein